MREKPIDGLNMIPFIDIMLVLLTIVLTTSSFIASGRIPVSLPQASENVPESSEAEIIEIDAQGVLYYMGEPMEIAQLEARLALLDSSASFLLRADRTVELQRFVDVADLLKRLGFSKVAVQTQAGGR